MSDGLIRKTFKLGEEILGVKCACGKLLPIASSSIRALLESGATSLKAECHFCLQTGEYRLSQILHLTAVSKH